MHSGWNCSRRVNFAEWPLRHPVDSTAIPDRCCFSHTSIVGQGQGTRKTIRNGGRHVMITKAPRVVHLTCIYQHPACSGFISSDRQALVAGWQKWFAWLHSLAGPRPKLRPLPAYALQRHLCCHHQNMIRWPFTTLWMNEWTWEAECPLDKLLWCVNE